MWDNHLNNCSSSRNRHGIVLLVTLVLLVILSSLAYTLSSRLAAQRHRQQYIIDYQAARYGCNSAARCAFAKLQDINTLPLIDRPDEPDFSDLFALNEVEYKELLTEWAAAKETYHRNKSSGVSRYRNDANEVNDVIDFNDINSIGETNSFSDGRDVTDFNDPNSMIVRGPYGPPWPLVIKPIELKIGSAAVKIEIEDENAKYPLGWMLLSDEEVQREASAAFETFCEWMDVNSVQVDALRQELNEISEIKSFKLDFEPTVVKEETNVETLARREGRGRRRVSRRRTVQRITIPASVHSADFAKLFHSSLIDTEALALPTIVSESRKESALKYMGLWASNQVNVNTAPRQVLEAAFTFGGDADEIAEGIIQRRRIKPFENLEDLRKSLFKYSDSVAKCEKYITTTSRFFTIRITAVSGVAEASTVFAITKDGKKIEKIAEISG